ncbi:hypothetical protein ANANG_G00274640 [Anguilla anguilla]|uniref:Transformer-2 protein homolog alpha n=1 Tax=Anguilla anguilla TaxID=7936 RepID=A0A9D3LLP4_ANGAN|nr:hypothetical protein ANANG_G00274640 [Anguilla anguilla]
MYKTLRAFYSSQFVTSAGSMLHPCGRERSEEAVGERAVSLSYKFVVNNLNQEDMSDNEKDFVERVKVGRRKMRKKSNMKSVSPQGSGKSASRSPAQSPALSKEGSRHSHSKSRSRSRSKSRSRSHRSSRRHYSRSRSRSHRRSSEPLLQRGIPAPTQPQPHPLAHVQPPPPHRQQVGLTCVHPSHENWSPPSCLKANPDPNCCLGVFGLSLYTTERDLREVFSKYGPISDVSIVYDQQSRRSRGFAFVYFENREDSKEAKERANGMELDGRRIRVDFSITKRPHTPTPGIYMGRPTYGGGAGGPSVSRRYSRDYYDRGYDRGYDRYDDRDYYRSYRRRSPSPYYSRGAYRSRSRSRSYSPRHY